MSTTASIRAEVSVSKEAYGALYNYYSIVSGTPYDNWFFPSKDELGAMYTELYLYEIGNFSLVSSYGTSSEYTLEFGGEVIWQQAFNTGVQSLDLMPNENCRVRACRSFAGDPGDYNIRDVGPSGGWIFAYDSGYYYEAAATDQGVHQWSNIWSGLMPPFSGTGTAIGTGQANTTLIIGQAGHTDSAAKLCDDLILVGGSIAPNGWRLPTLTEVQDMIIILGDYELAGGKLKETGTSHWLTPNTGASNSSGFTGVGGGTRDSSGYYSSILYGGYYWFIWGTTPSEFALSFYDATTSLNSSSGYAKYGFSLRLVKDSGSESSLTDYDGNIYDTVVINSLCWIKENWRCTHYNDGTAIPVLTSAANWSADSTGAMCYYNNIA